MFKKSSKFFEGNKFSRLNHYGFALRSITASGLLTVSLVAPCLLHAGDLPYYRTELCKSVDQAKLREDVKTSIMTLNDKLPEMERLVKESVAEKHLLADCFAKRLEITKRLGSYLEGLLKSDEVDAILFARQGTRELADLLLYFQEMREHREFLKSAPQEKILNVRDFGAKGDGVQNDAPAFTKAFEAAKNVSGPVKVKIPAGTYVFGSYEPKRSLPCDADGWRTPKPDFSASYVEAFKLLHVPMLKGYKYLSIEGEKGALLLGADPRVGFFLFRECSYLSVRNLTFDYRHLPFTQGVLTEVDEKNGFVRLKLDEGYPALDLDYFLEARSLYAITYNGEGTSIKREARVKWIGGVKDCGDRNYLIKFSRAETKSVMAGLASGCKLLISARMNMESASIVKSSFCSHFVFENLTVYSSPCEAFGSLRPNDQAVIGCKIGPPPSSNRLLAVDADPCMVVGPIIGPYLANNIFERAGDDFSNDCCGGRTFDDVAEDGSWFIAGTDPWTPGYAVSLLDTDDGTIKGEAIIKSVEQLPGANSKVIIDSPFSNTRSLKSLGKKEMSQSERYLFETTGGTQASLFPDAVINRRYHGSGTVISNNVFRYGRAAGIFTKVSNAIVEGNTLENLGDAMSLMIYACHYLEPNAPHNVVIRDNVFRWNISGVSSFYRLYKGAAPGVTPIRDILIEGNIFKDSPSSLRNCQDVKVVGNKFESGSPLRVGCAKNVMIENNSFALPEAKAVNIGKDAKGVTLNGNIFAKP